MFFTYMLVMMLAALLNYFCYVTQQENIYIPDGTLLLIVCLCHQCLCYSSEQDTTAPQPILPHPRCVTCLGLTPL